MTYLSYRPSKRVYVVRYFHITSFFTSKHVYSVYEFGHLNMKCCYYVLDAMDQLEQRVSEFFMNAKKNKPEWREEQMASIKKVCSTLWMIYL